MLHANKEFIPWIISQYKQGAAIASLCIGAFLLASTGLLKGRKCATHWAEAENFRKRYPDVDLVEDKIITDENGIYTSGGAYSWLNLVLYLVKNMQEEKLQFHVLKYLRLNRTVTASLSL
jgi:transcriptional regulator GlxA family with amidase domain